MFTYFLPVECFYVDWESFKHGKDKEPYAASNHDLWMNKAGDICIYNANKWKIYSFKIHRKDPLRHCWIVESDTEISWLKNLEEKEYINTLTPKL